MSMQRYFDRDRRGWRNRLHYLLRRANAILALAVLLAVLLPGQAAEGTQLAARTCPAGYPIRVAHGCRSVGGNGVACDNGYQGTFSKVNGRWVGKCVAGPVVWGG